MKRLLILFAFAWVVFCQPPPPTITTGSDAPTLGTCNLNTVGNIYVRSEDPANGPSIPYFCRQAGPSTLGGGAYIWTAISISSGTTGQVNVAAGKTANINNSLTFAGTDLTTLTFPTTTATIARTDAAQTFTGTQTFGALAATTLNGNTFTAGTGVLTIAAAKTLTANNTLTLAGTDGTTMTFPTTSATLARTDAANTFTGLQTMTTVSSNAFIASGTTPSVATCGAIGTGSKNGAGFITSATTGACVSVLTFTVTATTGWSCSISNSTTANLIRQTGSSTTTATFSGTTVSGDVLPYSCLLY